MPVVRRVVETGLRRWVGSSFEGLKGKLTNSQILRAFPRSSLARLLRGRLVTMAYVGALLLFSAGIVNAIVEGSRPQYQGGLILLTRTAQSLAETILNAFTIILGTAGVYLVYLSGRQLRSRMSGFYLSVGLVVLILAVSLGYYLVLLKRF